MQAHARPTPPPPRNAQILKRKKCLEINPAIGRPGREWTSGKAGRLAEIWRREIADGRTRIPGVEDVAGRHGERQVVAPRCRGGRKHSTHAMGAAVTAAPAAVSAAAVFFPA